MDCRFLTRVAVGAGFAALLAGCYSDADAFNAEAAERICEFNRSGPEAPILDKTTDLELGEDAQPYGGATCEDDVISNLDVCASNCEYNPRKGRQCLRKLRRSIRRGEFREGLLNACGNVYDCPDEEASPEECRITITDCSVGGDPPALTLMLLLGLCGRRRRRGLRHRKA